MRFDLARLALGALTAALWFSACGGNTGRRPHGESDAGQPAASAGRSSGGSAPIQAEAGASIVGLAGAEGLPEGGRSAMAGAPALGDAGQPSQQGGETGVAGAPQTGAGGAGGEASSAAGAGGAGGEGGAPLDCCVPRGCDDLPSGEECTASYRDDGCGKTFICKCDAGSVCLDGNCADCDPSPDACAGGLKCGSHWDSCGSAIQCPDDCQNVKGPLGVCYAGYCCSPGKTECAPGDCGYMKDGCGGFIDCTDNACQEGTCQLNGRCCTPSVACSPLDCGYIDDGCGNYLNCGDPCGADEVCLDNGCETSLCKQAELECDHVYSPYVSGFEYCGSCPQGVACMDYHCVPFCE